MLKTKFKIGDKVRVIRCPSIRDKFGIHVEDFDDDMIKKLKRVMTIIDIKEYAGELWHSPNVRNNKLYFELLDYDYVVPEELLRKV